MADPVVSRTLRERFWASDRRETLEQGTRLHRIEVVHYLESTCAGPFLSSVGRYEILEPGPRVIAEITHATVHDDEGPLIEDHPDLVWFEEDWENRRHRGTGLEFDLPIDAEAPVLSERLDPTGRRVAMSSGTRLLYHSVGFDSMRLDQCVHYCKVLSGPSAGTWIGLMSMVGDPLPWERA